MPSLCHEDIAIAYNALEGDTVFVWKAPNSQSGVASARPSKLARALELCEKMADWNCYITLNPHGMDSKPRIDDIRRVEWLMLDFDPKETAGSDWTFPYDRLTELLARHGVSFHYDVPVIQSGRGIQMWVPVSQGGSSVRDAHAAFKVIGKGVAELFADHSYWQFDTTCCDVSRLVRCPGTINTRTGRLASIAMPPGPIRNRIDLGSIALPEPAVAPKPIARMDWMYLAPRMHQMNMMFLLNGTMKYRESRHGRLFNCANDLRNAGVPAMEATKLLSAGAERCYPNLLLEDPNCVTKVIGQLWT